MPVIPRHCLGLLVAVSLLAVGCASVERWSLEPPTEVADDMRSLTNDPVERDPSLYWDAVHQSSFYLAEQSLDLPRQYRKLTGRLHEAVNVDVFGEVPNSSWFTNRHGQERMTRDELKRGPNQIAGPELVGPWTITRAKTQGVTPGCFFKDANGESFVLKFDPAMHPELATGAEMVSTKLFHAIGYHVPENYLVTFDPSILSIKAGLEYKDLKGKRHAFTTALLEDVLTKVALRPDGKIRAIASRLLPGKPVGPFSYKGRRKDDPNDLIPHQHRRELRGMKVFAELVNHFDTKDHNTLDVIVEEDGRRYVQHYMIDFGSTLGSDGDEPKAAYKGYSYVIDLEQALVSLATLGMRRWSWEKAEPSGIPAAIGYFESDLFEPPGWKPLHGNPAFDNMTYSDAQWACQILAQFEKDDLLACVETAEYSDAAATEYMVETLWERRAKILKYYSSKVNLLDNFMLTDDGQTLALSFKDFSEGHRGVGTVVEYEVSVERSGETLANALRVAEGIVAVPSDVRTRMVGAAAKSSKDSDRVFEIEIAPRSSGATLPGASVYVYFDGDPLHTRVVGIENDN